MAAHSNQAVEFSGSPSSAHHAAPRMQLAPSAAFADRADADADVVSVEPGCCSLRTCCLPFTCKTWLLFFFMIVVDFPLAVFAFTWCVSTLALSLGLFILFPIGVFLAMFSIATWRALADLELSFQRRLADKRYPAVLPDVRREDDSELSVCSCAGFWSMFKLLVCDVHTWKALVYFVVVKFTLSLFLFVWSVSFIAVGVGLIFNFVRIAECDEHDCKEKDNDWGQGEKYRWIVDSYKGSAITVPLGYLVLCFGLISMRRIARFNARVAYACLAPDTHSGNNERLLGNHV